MITRIRTQLRRDEGASAVEYGLLVALIAAVIALAVFFLGNTLKDRFNATGSCVSSSSNC